MHAAQSFRVHRLRTRHYTIATCSAGKRARSVARSSVARPLLIDNYDSYSYNLYQILAEVYGVEPLVYHNDSVTLEELQQLAAAAAFQHIVLSPGPGHPATPGDIGVCLDILRHFPDTPVLGVCLGHQALGHVHGAAVLRAPEPVHGRLSSITHCGHPLFKEIPSGPEAGFDVVRYHSLVVDPSSCSEDLIPLAWTAGSHHAVQLQPIAAPAAAYGAPSGHQSAAAERMSASHSSSSSSTGSSGHCPEHVTGMSCQSTGNPFLQSVADALPDQQQQHNWSPGEGLLMALAHRSRPHYGVQFHPESIATKYGVQLLANFRDLAYQHMQQQLPQQLPRVVGAGPPGRCPDRSWPWPPVHSSDSSSRSSTGACSSRGSSSSWGAHATGSSGPSSLPPRSKGNSQATAALPSQHLQQLPQEAAAPALQAAPQPASEPDSSTTAGNHGVIPLLAPAATAPSGLHLSCSRLPGLLRAVGGSQALFEALCGPGPDTFWLDSASEDRGRFSFMGARGGPLWCRILYQLPAPCSQDHPLHPGSPHHHQQQEHAAQQQVQQHNCQPGLLHVELPDGSQQQQQLSIWEYLEQQLAVLQLAPDNWAAAAALPFNFWGGFVGYLGYELKAECGGQQVHRSPTPDAGFFFVDRLLVVDHHAGDVYLLAVSPAVSNASSPGGIASQQSEQQQQWLAETAAKVAALASQASQFSSGSSSCDKLPDGVGTATGHSGAAGAPPGNRPMAAAAAASAAAGEEVPVHLAHNRAQYLANVEACQQALVAGESYELCLTTAVHLLQPPEPWEYYQALRRVNPAPYAAWMQFGQGGSGSDSSDTSSSRGAVRGCSHSATSRASAEAHAVSVRSSGGSASAARAGAANSQQLGPTQQQEVQAGAAVLQPHFTICCSSPERFMRGERGGLLEARPIKGTARRSSDPDLDAALAAALVGNEKDRAENLMIVDLLRNDLGRVCEVGSVHVPGLIELESHATVHQLVSTVHGLRKQGVSCVQAVRAAFPGGSMTGAPKLRSMQILDGLEGRARGVYSGALGYFSINDTFDLNIVIRTAVLQGGQGTVGAGGAVVVQSDPQREFEEMQLKAASLVAACGVAGQVVESGAIATVQLQAAGSAVTTMARPAAAAAATAVAP